MHLGIAGLISVVFDVARFYFKFLLSSSKVDFHDGLQKYKFVCLFFLQVGPEDLDAHRFKNEFAQISENPGEGKWELFWGFSGVPVQEEIKK